MMDWNGGWGVGGWLAMSLMMVVVWGLPIALVVWAVRSSFHRDQPSATAPRRPDADQVLADRYARWRDRRGRVRPPSRGPAHGSEGDVVAGEHGAACWSVTTARRVATDPSRSSTPEGRVATDH